MNLEIIKLLFDVGLLILIWMIQLVVYPSFSYYQKNDLLRWHNKYTYRISYIVIPLMIGQLGISIVLLIKQFTMFNIISIFLILAVWISTFTQFVPLHYKISADTMNDNVLRQLVKRNWLRTGLWTCIFVVSCAQMI